jgi:antagonist of KipI
VLGPRIVRAVDGPHASEFDPAAARAAFWGQDWTVTRESDRMGLRLTGASLGEASGPEPVSLGMVWGAVQVPPGGSPIVLLADGPTVGGYRVIAVAASVDRPVLGQLRAGDLVRFERVDLDRAVRLAADASAALEAARSRLRMAEPMA